MGVFFFFFRSSAPGAGAKGFVLLGAGTEVEEPGLELTPTYHASTEVEVFKYYTKALAPDF